ASLSAAQGVINIGSGRAVRLRDAAATLARVAGYGGGLHELDAPPGALRPVIGHPRAESVAHRAEPLAHRAEPLGHRAEPLGHRAEAAGHHRADAVG
ncbi:reductase, partial [Streptomyces sp. TRM76130]|nr:reductase [Streptomyces sp. TRM76130]